MATKIHVSNLSFDTTKQSLRTLFESDGRKVERLALGRNRETGERSDSCLVQMSSPQEAKAAIDALNGHELDGNVLAVRLARLRPARPE